MIRCEEENVVDRKEEVGSDRERFPAVMPIERDQSFLLPEDTMKWSCRSSMGWNRRGKGKKELRRKRERVESNSNSVVEVVGKR